MYWVILGHHNPIINWAYMSSYCSSQLAFLESHHEWTDIISCHHKISLPVIPDITSCYPIYYFLLSHISLPVIPDIISCYPRYHFLLSQILFPVIPFIISCYLIYHILLSQIAHPTFPEINYNHYMQLS